MSRILTRWTTLLTMSGAAVLIALFSPAATEASDCMTLELPDGQERAEMRDEMDLIAAVETVTGGEFDSGEAVAGCVEFRDDGRNHSPVEVAIIVVHPVLGIAPDVVRLHVDGVDSGRIYREVISPERRVGRNIRLTLHPEAVPGNSPGSVLQDAFRNTQVILMMERNRGRCTMSARVSGDASGHFFGDVAYINDLKGAPVKQGMAAGSLADPESHEMMGDFIDGMGEMALKLREMGYETPGINEEAEPLEGSEEFAAFIEEELRAGDGEPGDNFGLSLADVKLDGNTDKSRAAAAALFGNAFTLNLSGTTRSEWGPAESGPEGGIVKFVDASSITATVGLGDEGDTIPFVLAFGARPRVRFDFSNEDYATGSIVARLETEGTYTIPGLTSPRQLQIQVDARFVARKGAFGCMR